MKSLSALKRLVAQALPYRKSFFLAGFLAVILAPIGVLRPTMVQETVDNYIIKNDYEGVVRMMALMMAVVFLEATLVFLFSYISSWLGQSVVRDLRIKIFNHINSLRLSYFDQTPVGRSITRTISDTETLNSVFSEGLITIIADLLSIIVVIGVMFSVSWKLTLVSLSVLPFLIYSAYLFKEGIKKAFDKVRTQVANMNSFLQERITGMRIVQIFNVEKEELEQFKKINDEYTQANLDSIFWYAVFFPIVEIISAAALGLMVWFGTRGVLDNSVTVGALVAFPIYIGMLFRPVRVLADKFNTLQMGLIAAERVFEILDNNEKIPNNGTLSPEKLNGNVSFQNVFFTYSNDADNEEWILKNLSFELPAGQTLAIVGATGSGKSTIINLLSRFYEIQKGAIKIDNRDIKEYELHALRRRIAVVLQDVFLFSGTVFENITLRDKSISFEMVEAAAKMIGAHEFIMKLPEGYNYEVQERGATLSMGQRQLISFVRALVFDPDILVLDEATSSVDSETESVIQYAIETLIAKRTSVIIAHRLSTIQHAAQVLVLQKGEILEMGSPHELMTIPDGHYRGLYERQFEVEGV